MRKTNITPVDLLSHLRLGRIGGADGRRRASGPCLPHNGPCLGPRRDVGGEQAAHGLHLREGSLYPRREVGVHACCADDATRCSSVRQNSKSSARVRPE